MKPRTYFGIALLFPYILWGMCALVFYLVSSQGTSEAWSYILIPIGIYTFGIFLWFIPYTVLAIGIWLWSRNKSIQAIYKAGILAPFFLALVMLVVSIPLSIGTGDVKEMFKSAVSEALVLGGFSLVFGYLCVGIVLGLYKFLLSKNIITVETMINNELLLSDA